MNLNHSLQWKELYTAAILEGDGAMVLGRISRAKMAICDRVEELNDGGGVEERMTMNRAWKALCELESIYSVDAA